MSVLHASTPTRARPQVARRADPRRGMFRAYWRWHFYASFLVVPFLLMLSATGLIYLFRFELEPLLHPHLMVTSGASGGSALSTPYDDQLAAVASSFPDHTVVSMTEPSTPDSTTRFSLDGPDESTRDVFVDPWSGEVLGSLDPDTTLSGAAIRLHGDLMVGRWGDHLIELATCWAVVMAVTGYLIFVQGRRARLRRLAARAKGAGLRHSHALVGAVAGVGLVGLLVTGLPWTGIWGEQAQRLATSAGTSLWRQDHGALSEPMSTLDESLPHSHAVPWALGASEVPRSGADDEARAVADLDTALAVAERDGLAHPMTVALPDGERGVFSVISDAFGDPGRERTLHVDRFGGHVVATYGWDDYPALAKVVSQGIALHEGRRFGAVSLWVTAAFCLAVMALCLTGPAMWWRRRPRGSATLGAPRGKLPVGATRALRLALAGMGVLMPVFGVSLLLVLVVDQLIVRHVPALARWFGSTT